MFDSKLIISKTPEIKNLVEDYEKSVNNVFKTLMVFFVSIPIFTTLTVIFYNLGKTELAIYAGAFTFCFLVVAFYTMLFTSGSSLIKVENITKIKIQKNIFNNFVVIFHRESGRLKERFLVLEKNQVDTMKNSLLSEKLIEEKDIKLKSKKISIQTYIIALVIIAPFYMLFFKKVNEMMAYYYGAIVLFASAILMIKMMLKLNNTLFNKTTNR